MVRAKRWIVPDAAKEIGIAVTTLYRWIDRGEVKTELSPRGFVLIVDKEVRELKEWVYRKKVLHGGTLPRGPEPGLYRRMPRNHRQRNGS